FMQACQATTFSTDNTDSINSGVAQKRIIGCSFTSTVTVTDIGSSPLTEFIVFEENLIVGNATISHVAATVGKNKFEGNVTLTMADTAHSGAAFCDNRVAAGALALTLGRIWKLCNNYIRNPTDNYAVTVTHAITTTSITITGNTIIQDNAALTPQQI